MKMKKEKKTNVVLYQNEKFVVVHIEEPRGKRDMEGRIEVFLIMERKKRKRERGQLERK